MDFLPYAKQSIQPDDIAAVADALKGDWITRGVQVKAFEEGIASYCGALYAVAFNSGTSALSAAYFAAEASPYDRVVTTPNTFIGTVVGAGQSKSKIVFSDIDPKTGQISLEALEANINHPLTLGKEILVPVHFAGPTVEMRALSGMIKNPSTVVIEDAAHALGSSYSDGQKVGSCAFSDMTIFSFHPAKQITTGEGGMVTTNNEQLYQRLLTFRNNGIQKSPGSLPWVYDVTDMTGNFHMNEMEAALGLSQLKRLPANMTKRRRLVEHYRKELQEKQGLSFLSEPLTSEISYHLFVALIDFDHFGKSRELVMEGLKEEGIGTQVHYIPLYKMHCFQSKKSDCSGMEDYYAKALTLPLYADLDLADVTRVCDALKKVLAPAH